MVRRDDFLDLDSTGMGATVREVPRLCSQARTFSLASMPSLVLVGATILPELPSAVRYGMDEADAERV